MPLLSRVHQAMLTFFLGLNVFSGCASWQPSQRDVFRVAADKKIYVAPFVDFTDAHAGVKMMYALQSEIYRANAEKHALAFDENAVIVDGTVLSFKESIENERYFLQAELDVQLKAFSGKHMRSLPSFKVAADFLTAKSSEKLLSRRERAKERMWAEAALHILNWL